MSARVIRIIKKHSLMKCLFSVYKLNNKNKNITAINRVISISRQTIIIIIIIGKSNIKRQKKQFLV